MIGTRDYHEYLIKSLQDMDESAAYIQAILEEKDPEQLLLLTVLKDVMLAQNGDDKFSLASQANWQKLQALLQTSGGAEIYCFVEWLNDLGFSLKITANDRPSPQPNDRPDPINSITSLNSDAPLLVG